MKKITINKNWTFYKDGFIENKINVTLPYDAMLREKRVPNMENGASSGFFPGGKYIYEHEFDGDDLIDKKVLIEFEGIYMNSSVFLNDEYIGGHIYGYTDFYLELTNKIKKGKNILRVIADNSKTPNSRWYSGSGIYRPVNLWVGDLSSILPDSIQVKTISLNPVTLKVSIDKELKEDESISLTILDNGKEIMFKEIHDNISDIVVNLDHAKLWSAEDPNLYVLKTKLIKDNKIIDEDITRFGIRTIGWNSKEGFLINDEPIKLKGGCIHHDNGILGAETYDKAEYRKIKTLKEYGFNAIRSSHNPAGKNLLKICDELGMLVIDESFDQWKMTQTKYDYASNFDTEWKKDVILMVKKDYNHPSVIMYGIGNEITDVGLPFGSKIAKMIGAKFHELDNSRPTMLANNHMLTMLADMQYKESLKAKDNSSSKIAGSQEINDVVALLPKLMFGTKVEDLENIAKESFEAVDIVGYNYGFALYKDTLATEPSRVILSSETFPKLMDTNWKLVYSSKNIIGDFLWTAWDYLGEAGVGEPTYGTKVAPFSKTFPCLNASCGSFDLTGFPETQAIYNAIIWGVYKKPYIAVRPLEHSEEDYTLGNWRLSDAIPCWTWNGYENKIATIEVYSIGESIKLFKDDELIGESKLENSKAIFKTPYNPSILKAISYDKDGNIIAFTILNSEDDGEIISILPEEEEMKADGEDILFVPIHVVDGNNNLRMTDDYKLNVEVNGAATLIGLGSARCKTEEDFFNPSHITYHGRLLLIIRSNGKNGNIHIKVSGENLESKEIVLNAK